MRSELTARALAGRLRLSQVRRGGKLLVSPRGPAALAGRLVPPQVQRHLEATKLPLTLWFLAMHLLTQAKNNVSTRGVLRTGAAHRAGGRGVRGEVARASTDRRL